MNINTNGWNDKKEKQLRVWIEKCKIYEWLHIQASEYYSFINYFFVIPPPILSVFVLSKVFITSDENLRIGLSLG